VIGRLLCTGVVTGFLLVAALHARPQAPPKPDQLLARAVSLVVACGVDVRASQENNGKVKPAELSDREKKMQANVSMPILFQPGRYAFTGIWSDRYQGLDVWTVAFAPAASGQPGPRPGQDERLNRAMNNMEGRVQIDKKTGGIVHVDAWLHSSMFFSGVVTRFGIPSPVTVTILSATVKIDQTLFKGVWQPDRALLDVWAIASVWFLAGPVHYSYPASFRCAK
jgi:hypothetical protein